MPSIKDCTTKSVYFNLITDEDVLFYIENSNLSFSTLIKRLIRKEMILNPVKITGNETTINVANKYKYKYTKGKSNFNLNKDRSNIAKVHYTDSQSTNSMDTIVIIPRTDYSIQKIQGNAIQFNDIDNVIKTVSQTNTLNNNASNDTTLNNNTIIESKTEPVDISITKSKLNNLLGNQTMLLQK